VAFTASARRVGRTLKHEVDVNGRHTIATDEPRSIGGTDEGPAPHELLPVALAACIGTMMALYAERRDWDIGEISVDVEYDAEATPRRFDVTVYLPDDMSPDQRRRLERVAKTCPVRRALEAGSTFEERFVTAP